MTGNPPKFLTFSGDNRNSCKGKGSRVEFPAWDRGEKISQRTTFGWGIIFRGGTQTFFTQFSGGGNILKIIQGGLKKGGFFLERRRCFLISSSIVSEVETVSN